MVEPAVVNGSETWAMTEVDMKTLNTLERKILRRIYGPVEEQGIWRIRTNQEMREVYKDLDTAAPINKKKLEWIGHAVRKDERRTVKKTFESKPEGSRRRRRPKMRW
jgi:hypothetical protein